MTINCNSLPDSFWGDIVDMPTYYPSLDDLTGNQFYEQGAITLLIGKTIIEQDIIAPNLVEQQLLHNQDSVCLHININPKKFINGINSKRTNVDDKRLIEHLFNTSRPIDYLTSLIAFEKERSGVTHCFINSIQLVNDGGKTKSIFNEITSRSREEYKTHGELISEDLRFYGEMTSSELDNQILDHEVGFVMSELNLLARKLNIPIVLISHATKTWIEDADPSYIEIMMGTIMYCLYSRKMFSFELLDSVLNKDDGAHRLEVRFMGDNDVASELKTVLDYFPKTKTIMEQK